MRVYCVALAGDGVYRVLRYDTAIVRGRMIIGGVSPDYSGLVLRAKLLNGKGTSRPGRLIWG